MFNAKEFISGITFPGVIGHELGHLFFCKICRVKVKRYRLLQPFDVLGYVQHEKPRFLFQQFLITSGPFIFNTILALYFFYELTSFQPPYTWVILWLGFSLAYNSFPSRQDAKILYEDTLKSVKRLRIYNLIYLPVAYFLYKTQFSPIVRSLAYPILLIGIIAF